MNKNAKSVKNVNARSVAVAEVVKIVTAITMTMAGTSVEEGGAAPGPTRGLPVVVAVVLQTEMIEIKWGKLRSCLLFFQLVQIRVFVREIFNKVLGVEFFS